MPYRVAPNMNTLSPYPGEEYPYVNTQLFGTLDPPANRAGSPNWTRRSTPRPALVQRPSMGGFVG